MYEFLRVEGVVGVPGGLGEAERGLGEAERGLGEAERGLGEVERGLGEAERGLGEAERGLGEAERGLDDEEPYSFLDNDDATYEGLRAEGVVGVLDGLGEAERSLGEAGREEDSFLATACDIEGLRAEAVVGVLGWLAALALLAMLALRGAAAIVAALALGTGAAAPAVLTPMLSQPGNLSWKEMGSEPCSTTLKVHHTSASRSSLSDCKTRSACARLPGPARRPIHAYSSVCPSST